MADHRARRNLRNFLTGAVEEPEERPPSPPSSVSEAPLYPPARTRRPVTHVARPVSATPPAAPAQPTIVDAQGQPEQAVALPDHLAPPGAVLVAGVDNEGNEWVFEDDPDALPLVDPRYDDVDRNWVRYRTSWGGFLRLVLFALFVFWAVTTVRDRIYDWVDTQIVPGAPQGEELLEFTIPSGASTNNVATELEGQGIISNATVFRYWLRCEGELTISGFLGCDAERTFQAGDYELYENMAFEDVVTVLDEGPAPEVFVTFTIPEGLRLTEIVDRMLAVNTNFERDEIESGLRNPNLISEYWETTGASQDLRLEGTLFPATYDVNEDDLFDELRFLQRMADTFDDRYGSLVAELGYDPAIAELGLSDYEIITIASLIEEEARVDVDRPLMARAIYNRLQQGIPLQIDATVYYAAGKSFTEPLFQSDLDAESPWNTYTTAGIPPTPIAAPGEAALRATLAPAEGDFVFWARTDADGIVGAHTFSVTLDEHNAAVAVCRELGYCGMSPISGATVVVGVIGDPVRHSLSPALHNAAFAAMGFDAVSAAFPVPAGAGADGVAAMRALGLRGLSVTMPHKEAVAAAADVRSVAVEALGAANCLINDGGVITAVSTDGDGFVRGLQVEHDISVADRRVAVLGAGDAARAVVEACGRAGAADIVVVNRSAERAEAAASVGGAVARVGAAADIEAADLVVNATPVGMAEAPGLPLPAERLHAAQVVVDLIYHPACTELLAAAEAVGAVAVNGLPMLLHQAAIQFESWTGEPAPIDAMRAVITALSGCPTRPLAGWGSDCDDLLTSRRDRADGALFEIIDGGPPVALSGTLDTFALPDVLRLLATTEKTGRLRISGDRGSGSVWVTDGDLVATELTAANALEPTDVEVVFGLLRFDSGSFTFESDAIPPHAGEPRAMGPMLESAENMLGEWRSIEEVVPSLDVWVALTAELEGPDVMIDAQRWRCIAVTGRGEKVGNIAETLELNEIDTCRLVKELVELGLVELIETPEPTIESIDDTPGFAAAFDGDAELAEMLDEGVIAEDADPEIVEDPSPFVGESDEADEMSAESEDDDAEHESFDDHDDDHRPSFIDESFADEPVLSTLGDDAGPSTEPSLAALSSSDDHADPVGGMFEVATDGEMEGGELNPAEMARQLANLSPKAAKAVAAAAKASTDTEHDAALAAVEAEDASVNRGMLLKFLGSVNP